MNEIIRSNTFFQELQLRHTCCKYHYWGVFNSDWDEQNVGKFTKLEPDEITELRNEEFGGYRAS